MVDVTDFNCHCILKENSHIHMLQLSFTRCNINTVDGNDDDDDSNDDDDDDDSHWSKIVQSPIQIAQTQPKAESRLPCFACYLLHNMYETGLNQQWC